jgi:hypothetical protein
MTRQNQIMLILIVLLILVPFAMAFITWYFNRILEPLRKISVELGESAKAIEKASEEIRTISSIERIEDKRRNAR